MNKKRKRGTIHPGIVFRTRVDVEFSTITMKLKRAGFVQIFKFPLYDHYQGRI